MSEHVGLEAHTALALHGHARKHRAGGSETLPAGAPVRDVLEAVPIAILGIDRAGRIAFINARGRELFGYSSDELAGACASLLIPEWRMHGLRAMAPKPQSAASEMRTVVARCHDGVEFSAEVTTSPCRVDGVPIQLAVVVERSERDELHRNRQELAHLARVSALGELAGSLAHELNQPLTAILSNSQAAQRFMEADPINLREVRETLKDIVADNRRAGEIIQKMRALVRKCDIEWQSVDVGGVVHD
ncbi:MAG TPA: PAS domain S-box protein, partial [Paraburkholderia sp.]